MLSCRGLKIVMMDKRNAPAFEDSSSESQPSQSARFWRSVQSKRKIEALAVLTMAVGNIAAPMEDITRNNRILITRVGTIRTRERAIGMGVTSIDPLPLGFHCIQRN
jgi:hypothetical protein